MTLHMKWYGYALIAAIAALLVGCSSGKPSNGVSQAGGQPKGNTLRYALPSKPTEFDPAMVQDGDTIDLIQNIFEGLTTWGENNQPVPNLAEKWEITNGGKTYVFHLKKGVKFHNGREMKADDVAFSINRAASKELASPTTDNYLNDIIGYTDVHSGAAKEMSGIKVIDEYTVSLTIDTPRPYFLGKLTYPTSFVVAKEAVRPGEKMSDVAEMIGTGAFKAAEYKDGQTFRMTAYKDYHNGAPLIDGIDRPVMEDSQSRYNAYKRGEIDILAMERADVPSAKSDPDLAPHLKLYNRPSIYYVGLNQVMIPQFAKREVRQAIAMAIDKDFIVNEILGGQNLRADSILPPGVLGHRDKANSLPFDVAKAQELLAKAGYPGGKGFPDIKIAYRDGRPDVQSVADNIAQQLKQNLGLNVGQEKIEWTAYLNRNNAKKNPFFHMRWAADYLDPQNFLSLMLSTKGSENKIYYSNPEYDALCDQADREMDEKKRLDLYAKAEDIVLQDAPWVPIYFQQDAELISPRIQGMRDSLFGHLPHYKVSLKN
jgi:oligopeptide transport system substrate-binding protein